MSTPIVKLSDGVVVLVDSEDNPIGAPMVSGGGNKINGLIDGEQREFDWLEGPPGRYESPAPPSHRVLGFGEDGTGISTVDQTGQSTKWSQP